MKVRELIEELSKLGPDLEVIMSSDSEGNSFSPLSEDFSIGVYKAENSWRVEFYDDSWTAEDACMDEDEWEETLETHPYAIVFWPVN